MEASANLRPIRVDYKAAFSAERTFVQWIHLSYILSGVGLGLISSGWPGAKSSGLLMFLPACTFLVWGLISYYRRLHALKDKQLPGIEDKVGPSIALLVMIVVILLNVYKVWQQVPEDTDAEP